ncbi:hypothetical protein [Nocardiopsis tropica]|uniref:Uncharacterized protein n=1 Tax=Nocardiopsis tropica TaxID=109330 RepID=A0ABV2A2F1_9ACTN
MPEVLQVAAQAPPPPVGSGLGETHEYGWEAGRYRYRGLWEPDGDLDELMGLLPRTEEE